MKKLSSIFCMACAMNSSWLLANQWELEQRVEPRYPIEAAKSSQEGCVNVQFFVNSDGVPTYLEVLKSLPKGTFDKAAIKALEQWRYSPTETNTDRAPERMKVSLSFALSPNPDFVYECDAVLTAESDNMASFRKSRLSTPIVASDSVVKKQSLERIFTVLTDTEKEHFVKSYSQLELKKAGSNKGDSPTSAIDGLTYHQIIRLAGEQSSEIDSLSAKGNDKSMQPSTEQLPIMSFPEFLATWNIEDLSMGMESELFKQISYRQLKTEVLINSDGSAQLLSTCRDVSKEMQAALESQIADWEISSKVQSPEAGRFIYLVPSPKEPGAYVDCDDAWNDKHQQSM
ncbi:energy transducer TonB [Pseudoalteromonas sp. T1lg88]|uniref:energy transducer TonB n=1 Tax=Pseudoalteromonas sp. T1lg88 TaxID=2077104 RepID=UPI000CF6B252|nr:energy transducer TonB [Pseudoalteromonas sp. T1lg88]